MYDKTTNGKGNKLAGSSEKRDSCKMHARTAVAPTKREAEKVTVRFRRGHLTRRFVYHRFNYYVT